MSIFHPFWNRSIPLFVVHLNRRRLPIQLSCFRGNRCTSPLQTCSSICSNLSNFQLCLLNCSCRRLRFRNRPRNFLRASKIFFAHRRRTIPKQQIQRRNGHQMRAARRDDGRGDADRPASREDHDSDHSDPASFLAVVAAVRVLPYAASCSDHPFSSPLDVASSFGTRETVRNAVNHPDHTPRDLPKTNQSREPLLRRCASSDPKLRISRANPSRTERND